MYIYQLLSRVFSPIDDSPLIENDLYDNSLRTVYLQKLQIVIPVLRFIDADCIQLINGLLTTTYTHVNGIQTKKQFGWILK